MTTIYSISICPPQQIIDKVKLLKRELASRIEWFPSKNSEAHITLNNFETDKAGLLDWKDFLSRFCKSIYPFEVILNKTDSYPLSGTFYLSPDKSSKNVLLKLMRNFHKLTPFLTDAKSHDPHLSIARGLSQDKLDTAEALWNNKTVDLKFICYDIAIRQFDEHTQQYFVESRHPFSENPQLHLFPGI